MTITQLITTYIQHMRSMAQIAGGIIFPNNPELGVLLIAAIAAYIVYIKAKASTLLIVLIILFMLFLLV